MRGGVGSIGGCGVFRCGRWSWSGSGLGWGAVALYLAIGVVADVVVEVKAVDETDGDGYGIEVTAGGDRGGVLLELGIDLERDVIGDVEIEAAAVGEDVGDGVDVEERVGWIWVATVLVVNLSAADEEVGVGMVAAIESRQLDAVEDVLLSVDLATVDGVGAADFGCGIEVVEGLEADVNACGDAEVSAAIKTGKGARRRSECRELQRLGRSGKGLSASDGAGRKRDEQQRNGAETLDQSKLLVGELVR